MRFRGGWGHPRQKIFIFFIIMEVNMVTKAKKALLASLAAFLCVMLTVFGLSMSVSLSETAKAADETTTEVAEVNGVKFATLAEAIAAAKDGDTVTLLADATEDVVNQAPCY